MRFPKWFSGSADSTISGKKVFVMAERLADRSDRIKKVDELKGSKFSYEFYAYEAICAVREELERVTK